MQRLSLLAAGLAVGLFASLHLSNTPVMKAASGDRYQDYVMCTGAVTLNPRVQADGVWLLDYRSGKLLGSVVDKSTGKIIGWAEVYLPTEFSVRPEQDVHFVMTTGYISQGVSALYVAETTTGKFGVYTMGAGDNGAGIVIRRHDMTSFRTVQPVTPVSATTVPGMPGVPATAVPGQPFPQVPQPGMNVPTMPQNPPPGMTMPNVPANPQVPPQPFPGRQ